MIRGQAYILIQVYGSDSGEVQIALVVPVDQIFIGAFRAAACGKTQNAVTLQGDLRGDDLRCLFAHFVIIAGFNDFHVKNPFLKDKYFPILPPCCSRQQPLRLDPGSIQRPVCSPLIRQTWQRKNSVAIITNSADS